MGAVGMHEKEMDDVEDGAAEMIVLSMMACVYVHIRINGSDQPLPDARSLRTTKACSLMTVPIHSSVTTPPLSEAPDDALGVVVYIVDVYLRSLCK